MAQKEALFHFSINNFLGLNMSKGGEAELKPGESPLMKNFRITNDYGLKKRDGYTLLHNFSSDSRAMFITKLDREYIFFVMGINVFRAILPFDKNSICNVGTVQANGNCFFTKFNGKVYLWGGGKIQVYNNTFIDIEPYRPLIAVSCNSYTGAGTPFESINLLCGKLRKQFSPTSAGDRSFTVHNGICQSIDYVKYCGKIVLPRYYNVTSNCSGVVFDVNFSLAEGTNTIEIAYTLESSETLRENFNKIVNCKYHMFYGGENDTKIFLWGNDDYPDARFYSGLSDGIATATYFPENNFTKIGDGTKICDIIRQYDRQLIFCENAAYISHIEEQIDVMGKKYFSFPVRTLSENKGSIISGQTKLINNLPITLMNDGLYTWFSTDVRDERNAKKISEKINEGLCREELYSAKMYDNEYLSELYVYFPNGHIYVYNYANDTFYFYDNIPAFAFFADESGKLYFCDKDGGFFIFGGVSHDRALMIDAMWQSGYMDLCAPGIRKNLYSVDIAFRPENKTLFHLDWASDAGSGMIKNISSPIVSYLLFDFSAINFARFSFNTSHVARNKNYRLRAKRFNYIKLFFKNKSAENKIHIHKICLNGKYTD